MADTTRRTVIVPAGEAAIETIVEGRGPAPPLQKRGDNSPEDKCSEMEKEVNGLIEESARLSLDKQYQAALDRDYPELATADTADRSPYLPPKNPHPGSILWRSRWNPPAPEFDILREQAAFWGQHGIHYHQFLAAG